MTIENLTEGLTFFSDTVSAIPRLSETNNEKARGLGLDIIESSIAVDDFFFAQKKPTGRVSLHFIPRSGKYLEELLQFYAGGIFKILPIKEGFVIGHFGASNSYVVAIKKAYWGEFGSHKWTYGDLDPGQSSLIIEEGESSIKIGSKTIDVKKLHNGHGNKGLVKRGEPISANSHSPAAPTQPAPSPNAWSAWEAIDKSHSHPDPIEDAELSPLARSVRNEAKLMELERKLQHLRETLTREFTGYDAIIDKTVNRVAQIEMQLGEVPLQPIELIGMPGFGKTRFVERVGELLEEEVHTHQARIGDTYIPIDGLYKATEKARQGKKGLSGIWFVDEIQRVVAQDQDLDESLIREELRQAAGAEGLEGDPRIAIEKKITEQIEELKKLRKKAVEESRLAMQTLRDATSGKGMIAGRATRTVQELMAPIEGALRAYAEATVELEDSQKKKQTEKDAIELNLAELEKRSPVSDEEKKDLTEKLDKLKAEKKTLETAMESAAEDLLTRHFRGNKELVDSLASLFHQYGQLFKPFAQEGLTEWEHFMRPEYVVLQRIKKAPIATLRKIHETAKGLGPSPKVHAGSALSFIAGNDTEYNRRVLEEAGDTSKPERIKAASIQFAKTSEAKRLKQKFVRQVFGEDPDWDSWASRLKLPWDYLPHWGDDEWLKFAKALLKEDGRAFSEKLNKDWAINANIRYSNNSVKVIHDYGIEPVNGPRAMISAPGDVFGGMKPTLLLNLVQLRREKGHEKEFELEIDFDYEKRQFVVYEKSNPQEPKILHQYSSPVLEKANTPIVDETVAGDASVYAKIKMARRYAAKYLIGSLLMQSVPKSISFDPTTEPDWKRVWLHPDGTLKDANRQSFKSYDKNLILIKLAGVASELIGQDHEASQDALNELLNAESEARALQQRLEEQGRIQDAEREKGARKERQVKKVIPDRGLFWSELRELDAGKAINRSVEVMEELLKNKEIAQIYDQLTHLLLSKKKVSEEEFRTLFIVPKPKLGTRLRGWVSNFFLTKRPSYVPSVLSQELRQKLITGLAGVSSLTDCTHVMEALREGAKKPTERAETKPSK